MRKFSVIAVILTIASGAAGFIMRRLQLENAFETQSGLAIPWAPSTGRLHLFILIFAVVVLGVAIFATARYRPHRSFEDAYGTHSVLYPLVVFLTCIVWYYGTVLHFLALWSTDTLAITDILFIAFSAVAATCVAIFAIGMFQDSRSKVLYALSIMPITFLCLWLILHYRDNATNPILLNFVYQCIALIAASLSFYYIAASHFGKPPIGKATFSYGTTVLFCGITLADDLSPGMLLIFGSILIIAQTHLFLLLRSLSRK